ARIDAEDLPVQLLGHREDVGELLAGADLVVSAARWEGQPVSLQEALRAGRAIVATDAGGTRWVTGEAARLVPVGDAQALAAAITDHVDDEVRAAAEQASRQRAAQLPGRREMTAQLRAVLLGPPPPMVGSGPVADTSVSASAPGTGPIPRLGQASAVKPFRSPGVTKHIFVTGGVVSSLG